MSADIKVSWEDAKVARYGLENIFLAKMTPVKTPNFPLECLVSLGRPPKIEIPYSSPNMAYSDGDRDLILRRLEPESMFTELGIGAVMARRNSGTYRIPIDGSKKICQALELPYKEFKGYYIDNSISYTSIKATPYAGVYIRGDNIGLIDYFGEFFCEAFSPKGKELDHHPVAVYLRRMARRLKTFSVEPVNFQTWREKVVADLS